MTTVTVSNAFINTDLSGIRVGQSLNDSFFTIYEETVSWFRDGANINEEPDPDGNKFTITNPTINGSYATYGTTGSLSGTLDAYGETSSMVINLTNLTAWTTDSYEYGDGTIKFTGSIKGSIKNNIETDTYTVTQANYIGDDGSRWSVSGSLKYTYKENYITGYITDSFTGSFNSMSSSDVSGNSILLTGKYTYNAAIDDFTGYMTTLKVTIGSTQLTVTKLKITPEDWSESYLTTMAELLPNFLTGNDVITVSDSDPLDGLEPVFGYAGNDTINGSSSDDWLVGGEYIEYGDYGPWGDESYKANSGNDKLYGRAGEDSLAGLDGNDTLDGGEGDDELYGGSGDDKLIGGAGDDFLDTYGGGKDTLTGGTGSDVFSFTDTSLSNAKISTITDFKTSEGDKIEFYSNTLHTYIVPTDDQFYKALGATGVISEGQIFAYDTKSGKLYFDEDSFGGNPAVVVAILTGKPNLTVDDFEYFDFY